MKRYYTPDIIFGPVSDDEEVHAVYKFSEVQALLRAVAEEVKSLPKRHDYESYVVWRLDFDEAVGKVLAMLEVEK